MGQTSGPSQAEVNALLTQYQSGQYAVAEKLGTAMTQKYLNHQFGWKVLGAVFRATGRTADAVVANQKAVALVPNDAEAHSNLGITLQDLGRLEEAEASYRQAIALKPDYAEAHYNLGNALKDLGRLEDAEASYRQAIALKPDYAEAHSNLGLTLKELGRFGEALKAVVASIKMKPTAEAKKIFVTISMYIAPKSWDTALSEMVISALVDPWDRPSNVTGFARRLLKLDAGFMRVLNQTNGHATQSTDAGALDSFLANPLESSALLHAMLSSSHIADHESGAALHSTSTASSDAGDTKHV